MHITQLSYLKSFAPNYGFITQLYTNHKVNYSYTMFTTIMWVSGTAVTFPQPRLSAVYQNKVWACRFVKYKLVLQFVKCRQHHNIILRHIKVLRNKMH